MNDTAGNPARCLDPAALRKMNLRLITYRAEDGLELDGAYYGSDRQDRAAHPLVVMTHGTCMNFYTGPQRFLPATLVPAGFDCLAINSRDRDSGGLHPITGRCFGMIRGLFDDVLLDVSGALAWGRAHDYRSFVLACHSYSGQRAAFYLSRRQEDGVVGLAMISPPAGMRSNHRFWMDDWEGFQARARALVAAGNPDDLVIERPSGRFPIVVSARTALDLWVDRNPLEDTSYMEELTTPLLVTHGEKETAHDPTLRNADRIVAAWAGPVTRAVVPGAGHFYLENETALAEIVLSWLRALAPVGSHG
jgi:hypothetical protein